jgi:hypothetical protein
VVVGIAVDLLPVGGDDVQADDALARRPVDAAIPAVPALQQVTADADAFAVAPGKEQTLCLQVGHERAATLARADDRGPLLRIDRGMVEAADVQQHGTVTEMAGREAMSARDDAHLVSVGPGVAQAGDDVVGVDRLNDHLGVALGHAFVPYGGAACGFVPVVATEKVPPGRKRAHTETPLIRIPGLLDPWCGSL